jgi:hypothetical protein
MPKARELTEVEKFYIQNNSAKSDSEIASMMTGIGVKTVAKFRAEIEESEKAIANESDEERTKRLSGMEAGNFFARNSGATIMTKQVSEISDASRKVNVEMDKSKNEQSYRGKIHRPKS